MAFHASPCSPWRRAAPLRGTSRSAHRRGTPQCCEARSSPQRRVDARAAPLVDALCSDAAPHIRASFFCPGHNRGHGAPESSRGLLGERVFHADLPEDLPHTDNLFAPGGVIADAQRAAAALYGAEHSFFLVNGASCGVIAAVLAAVAAAASSPSSAPPPPGGDDDDAPVVALPKNAHQSAFHALLLSGAKAAYIAPESDAEHALVHGVTAASVRRCLQTCAARRQRVAAVLLVSPTYHGVLSDVRAVAAVCGGEFGAPLIVDEAHGAHLALVDALRHASALPCGADVVVHSTHKTLGSLTQSAMLHAHRDSRVPVERLREALAAVMSSSPSLVLLASLDGARQQAALAGRATLTRVIELADELKRAVESCVGLRVLERPASMFAIDPTRVTLLVQPPVLGGDGHAVDAVLTSRHGVFAELVGARHLTFVLGVGCQRGDISTLVAALRDATQSLREDKARNLASPALPTAPSVSELLQLWGADDGCQQRDVLTPRQAFFSARRSVPLAQCAGEVSAVAVSVYPPGIPVLLPGRTIAAAEVDSLQAMQRTGADVVGLQSDGRVSIIAR